MGGPLLSKPSGSQLTFQNGVGLQDLLLDPRVLSADCGQELKDELRGLGLPGPRLATARECRENEASDRLTTSWSLSALYKGPHARLHPVPRGMLTGDTLSHEEIPQCLCPEVP